ncbi:hypothetical protein GDO81_008277 [Engystomops pustulosus]|uniref:Translin-associated factor X-interacting protein 1 N-terminal domain-containing protein n=1 Tax=Engystomops pustulosus TaxID=76066 RepID=A0AAV7CDI9_ENGPU|nr:hypothetical protein GDO81_008277 [Engystomops pustulosus]KAG8583108.1 hypothetical protein GDO81_008277 [Engystomops pustulosus]
MLNTKQQAQIIPLDVLLDGVERANKKDSWDYTGGHLNHNHLCKPTIVERKSFWRSGKIPNQQYEKVKKMNDSFVNFTLNTSLVNEDPTVKSMCASSAALKQTGPFTPINTPFASSVLDTRSQTTFQESPEHKENGESPSKSKLVELPEIKLLKGERSHISQNPKKEYRFVPAYFTGLTKSDQFNMFLQFDRDILQKQDISKDFCNNLTECYEKKLTKELLKIANIRPPHFARLQIFSETFQNICSDSSIFGNILSKIKAAYDSYVDFLLDTQFSPQHEILMSEIAGMKKRPVKTEDVEEVMQNVRELENKAYVALEHNDQLRNYLKTELSKASISETLCHEAQVHSREADSASEQHHGSETNSICEQHYSSESDSASEQHHLSEAQIFVAKRSEVLETLKEVNALEKNIKKNLTHAINAEATEEYIKDIQTETMKLKSSNDFLLRATRDVDTEIKRVLLRQKFTLDKQAEINILIESFVKPSDL